MLRRQPVLSDLVIRFALLAGLPLVCLFVVFLALLSAPPRPSGGLPLTTVCLLFLGIGCAFSAVHLHAAYGTVRTINHVLAELGRQALGVAGADTLSGSPLMREGEVQWLTLAFQSMVESLRDERVQLEHRLSDLEAVSTLARAIIDIDDPGQFELLVLQTLVQILRASGAAFVSATQQSACLVAAVGIARDEVSRRAVVSSREPGSPLWSALAEGVVSGRVVTGEWLASSPAQRLDPHGTVALPLLEHGRAIGAIELHFEEEQWRNQRPVGERSAMLETLARLISVGYEHARTAQQLRESNVALQRANRLKSEFLANMSHELRTPMNSIIGYSQVLLDGIDGDLNAEQYEDVERVLRSAESLLAIINDILDLSKIEAGRIELHWQPVETQELVRSVVATARPLAEEKGLPLHVSFDKGVELTWGDPTRIGQMLLNLLSNAIKFTESGHVAVQVTPAEGRVRFAVSDTGIGIEREAHRLIFEEFRQADGSTSRRYGGTGLGLAITRRLAELHGSSIDLVSAPNEGSTFSFTLPTAPPRRLPPSPPTAAAPGEQTGKSVAANQPILLVVGAEGQTVEQVRRYVAPLGYAVVSLAQAEGLVAAVIAAQPRAILLDALLGSGEGERVLQQLKAHPETRATPVLLTSVPAGSRPAAARDAAGTLAAPLHREALLSLLQQALYGGGG